MSHEFTEYKEAWQIAQSGWSSYLDEAEKDLRAFCGDQWDPILRQYLKDQSRSDAVYNKVKRIVNFVSGYEMRNMLSLNGRPRGGSDDSLANQHSAILLQIMGNNGGNDVCSDAFKFGTCITGLNLIETYIDSDGNVAFNRDAYNQVLLDPMFTKSDLSDCAFILRERAITKDQAKLFFPGREKEIDQLQTGTTSNLFSRATHNSRVFTKHSIVYGEYHRQTLRTAIFIVDRQTGEESEFTGKQEELNFIASDLQLQFSIINKTVKSMNLQVYLQEELFYDGPDPYGMDEYRFTPIMGDYVPELPDDKYKLQGIIRSIRDPQVEYNKRMSQEVDILESQIASGWIAEEGQVVDTKSLYGTGQGKVIFVKNKMDDNVSGTGAVQRIPAPAIPAGMAELSNKQAGLIDSLTGTNEEPLGSDSKDIPGILSKMRTGAGLTILHPYFKGYRVAKQRIGKLIIKMVQNNYSKTKIEKLIEEQVHPQFYDADILQNDISVQEGILTDSQRELAYMEFKALKAEGAPIPWSVIFEHMPVADKSSLNRHIKQAEEAQQQAQQQQQSLEMQQLQVNTELVQSETAKNMATVRKSESEIIENLAEAVLDQVKALVLKEDHDNETNAGHNSEHSHGSERKPRHKKVKI